MNTDEMACGLGINAEFLNICVHPCLSVVILHMFSVVFASLQMAADEPNGIAGELGGLTPCRSPVAGLWWIRLRSHLPEFSGVGFGWAEFFVKGIDVRLSRIPLCHRIVVR